MSATISNPVGEQINYHIRPTHPNEVRTLASFVVELGRLEQTADSYGFEDYVEWFSSPFSLEYTRWQASLVNPDGSEGAMIGRAAVRPPNPDGIGFGAVEVHPDYRKRGVARALYDLVEQQAQALGVKTLNIEGDQRYTLLREFLQRRGFEFDRYSWEMLLPPTHPIPAAQWPSSFSVRSFVPEQDEQLYHHTINAAFADHFAVNYVPFEHILYIKQQPSFDPEGIFFAFAGEDVAGICVAMVRTTAEDEGWIEDLAVIPAYRRHGVGRALLLTGVNWLRQQVSNVKLEVEGKNERALPLYTSVGFQQHNGRFIIMKKLG